jgi:hypothetical protein
VRLPFILIFVCGLIVGSCTKYETPVFPTETVMTNITGGYPITQQVRLLTFKNTIGALKLTSAETDTHVNIRMTMQVTNPAGPAPTTQLNAIQMVAELSAESLHFYVNYPRSEPRYRYAAETTFLTPYRYACLVDSVQALTTISDVGATLTVRNVRETRVMRQAGSCSISSLGGGVYAEVTIPLNGRCIILAESGDITLKIPTNTSANVTARTSSGAVSSVGLRYRTLTQQQTSLSGQLEAGGSGEIRLETGQGNVVIQAWQQ